MYIFRCVKIAYRSNKRDTLNYLLVTAVCGIFTGITIFSIQDLINTIQESFINGGVFYDKIIYFVLINIISILVASAQQYYYVIVNLSMDKYIDILFLKKCDSLELKDFENKFIYDSINQIDRYGKDKVIEVFFDIIQFAESIVAISSIIGIVFLLSDYYWLLIILSPLVKFIINIRLGRYVYSVEESNTQLYRKHDYFNYILTNDIACKERITFNFGKYLLMKIKNINKSLYDRNKKTSKITININSGFSIFDLLIKLFLVVRKSILIFSKDGLIGNVFGYMYSLDTITEKFSILLNSVLSITSNKLYINTFYEFMDKETKRINNHELVDLESVKTIELKDLSYSYDKEIDILKKINIQFIKGNLYVVTGENGSGKSTLIKILCGLYDDYAGEMFVNGRDITYYDIEAYRNKTTVVFQDFNKYEMSLRENVALSNIHDLRDGNKIRKLISILNLDKNGFIQLDEQLGNWFGGTELSGGQWQKVAIARAMFKDSELIIMDEPTASLDEQSKKEVDKLLQQIAKNKIVIVVTHNFENPLISQYQQLEIVDGELLSLKAFNIGT